MGFWIITQLLLLLLYVLSFALYHEAGETNNNETNTMEEDVAAQVSDDDGERSRTEDQEDLEEPSSKRQRTDDTISEDKLKARVLSELAQNDGYLPIDEICTDNDDRDEILKIVETLVSEGKLMTEENDEGSLDVFPVSD